MGTQIQELLNGLDGLVKNDTVIGEPMKIEDATIVPLMEVTFGMAAGAFAKGTTGGKEAGGIGARVTPYAMLVVQNGVTKLINIKNQDAITKAVDLIPDFVTKLVGNKIDKNVLDEAMKIAEDAAE